MLLVIASVTLSVKAQSSEAQQLLLNWEKLAQFKAILQNMKDGYAILHRGYTAVKDISEGSFTLHKSFLDGLLQVSPAVKNYKRINDIIGYQLRIVKGCKAASNEFRVNRHFTKEEIDYVEGVYKNLVKQSLKSLDELAVVLTAGKLRMSDGERLQTIDQIYTTVAHQASFLKDFNAKTTMLSLQRQSEGAEKKLALKIHGLSR